MVLKTHCTTCDVGNAYNEQFTELVLVISDSISDSLRYYFATETLQGYIYDCCSQSNTTSRTIELREVPKILCLVICRNKINNEKDHTRVKIPERINMQEFINSTKFDQMNNYVPDSVICHQGSSTDYGHYYTVLRNKKKNHFC